MRVHTDLGVVCGVITGSFPTADAAFDPGRNALELALRLDDALRLDLADTVPTIVTDANLTKLRVDNVMDLEVERPMNLIHGQHTFRVAGFNMVLSDEGAAAYLQNAQGTTFALVIDRVTSHQLFEAHTAELLPAGDYKFVVKSRAGDAAGPLQTSFRKVKYLRVAPVVPEPTITGAKTRGESEGSVNIAGGILDVVGANLETATAVELHSDVQPTGEASLWQTLPATYADGKLTTGELDFDEKPDGGRQFAVSDYVLRALARRGAGEDARERVPPAGATRRQGGRAALLRGRNGGADRVPGRTRGGASLPRLPKTVLLLNAETDAGRRVDKFVSGEARFVVMAYAYPGFPENSG